MPFCFVANVQYLLALWDSDRVAKTTHRSYLSLTTRAPICKCWTVFMNCLCAIFRYYCNTVKCLMRTCRPVRAWLLELLVPHPLGVPVHLRHPVCHCGHVPLLPHLCQRHAPVLCAVHRGTGVLQVRCFWALCATERACATVRACAIYPTPLSASCSCSLRCSPRLWCASGALFLGSVCHCKGVCHFSHSSAA